ncbi:hypothetical protein [Acinetobacter sp. ANC 4641]|uniref:hypothetical protein n=1 Tax=Acinetobacter sp. ANC 4641 TaxID=2529847 RepID=UPI00103F13A7|nr:hypothetical protein [Acinetobacter sp. ANC 4641]TCB11040.1 hypothetical protein E0H78_08450 [Acinetobacter sp. ANC 4641]
MNDKSFESWLNNLTQEEVEEINKKQHDENLRQVDAFKEGYKKQNCYLCGKDFKTISKNQPCLHWLLRICKFKKNDFKLIYTKFGYHNIAAFLRWCANEEKLLSNINDLESEKSPRKILSSTIKWKNIEWTFDCSANDIAGHTGSHIEYPHYHFQMRIDGRPFINFNEYHVPFSDEDLEILKLKDNSRVIQNFGAAGSGMQDAVSVDPEKVIELCTPAQDMEDATYHFSTIVEMTEKPLTGEELYQIQLEAQASGESLTYMLNKKLQGRAKIQTVITPSESIPDIASRTEHKRR